LFGAIPQTNLLAGYSGGALKHGPFALIEEGTPIVLIILDDKVSICIFLQLLAF
jgi:glucosamine 6-phosphate synthetase-like amidotransferase/phosphosugar isomerase protein